MDNTNYVDLLENINRFPSYTALIAALCSIVFWRKKPLVWGSLFASSLLLNIYHHDINATGLSVILTFIGICFLFFRHSKGLLHVVLGVFIVLMGLSLDLHWLPGFHNWMAIKNVRLSATSTPLHIYVNYDNRFIGLILLGCGYSFFFQNTTFTRSKKTAIFFYTSCVTAAVVAMLGFIAIRSQYIKFDPKWNDIYYFWALNNLLVVCPNEEIFFRGFIQQKLRLLLKNYKSAAPVSIILASALFTIIHYRGGAPYCALVFAAGLLYGYIYNKTRSLMASIYSHFLLNSCHFLIFSYPAFMPAGI